MLLLSHHVDLSPRTRPREGSFDLWIPAGRFTNIKFAFKGVDGATVERATLLPRVGRVSCVYITWGFTVL